MGTKKQSIRQISDDAGVSYRTMLAWQKSRPELMNLIAESYKSRQVIAELRADIDALKAKIGQVHKLTVG